MIFRGQRKDIKRLQSRGKKTTQGHCQHPVGPKLLLSGKQQWSPNLSPQPHFSFPPIQSTSYRVTPLKTQFGSCFQKPHQHPPRLGILYFLKQGLHRGLKALSLKQTRPIPCSNMPHVSLPPCSYSQCSLSWRAPPHYRLPDVNPFTQSYWLSTRHKLSLLLFH